MDSKRIYGWAVLLVFLAVTVTGYPKGQKHREPQQENTIDIMVDIPQQTLLEPAAQGNRRDDEDNYMMPNMLDMTFGGFGKR